MTNKGILTDDKIVIESKNDVKIKSKGKHSVLDIKAGDVVHNKGILVEMFNNHYVNIVEDSTGIPPIELGTPLDPKFDRDTVEKILKHGYHSSVIKIKKLAKTNESSTFPTAKTEDINKIIDSLNPKKLLDLIVYLLK